MGLDSWGIRPTGDKTYDGQGFQHHAQIMAMNHYLHCARGRSEYAFFVDLDEYVFTPKAILTRCCEAGASAIFQCWWADFEDDDALERYTLSDANTRLRVVTNGAGEYHTKSLMKLSEVELMGVHAPSRHACRKVYFLDGFFHLHRFKGTELYPGFLGHSKICTQAEFVAEKFAMTALLLD